MKCKSTGRKCDGYEAVPLGTYSWEELIQRSKPVPLGVPSADLVHLHGLMFFNRIVAPELNGPLKSSFWTHQVPQAAHNELAVRHAALAIGSLYQNFGNKQPLWPKPSRNIRAINHYNLAIKYLTKPGTSLDTVLIVCILFVCTEFLCGDAQAAITHVFHGLSLVDPSQSSSDTVSILRHLAIFPHFFSQGVPNMPIPDYPGWLIVDGAFKTLYHAEECLDSLACHTVRLMRMVEYHRLGIGPRLQSLESATLEQRRLEDDLEAWQAAFSELRRNLKTRAQHELCLLLLEMRWFVARIWASTCLSSDELIYDEFLASFVRIVELASQAKVQTSISGTVRGTFSFGMGFSPLLHFVVLKCRDLELRLTARSLMMTLSWSRESLWNCAEMYAIGTRIIEREHGVILSGDLSESEILQHDQRILPNVSQRILDSTLEAETQLCTDDHGAEICRRKIRFLVKSEVGLVQPVYDWVTIR